MKQLITNVHILTMDEQNTEYKDGYLLIEENRIAQMGFMKDTLPTADKIVDGQQGILMPGMINTHTHVGMIPFRSLVDDVPDSLRRFLFPMEAIMHADLVKASAKYAMAEMLLAGVTSFCDMYYFEDDIAQAASDMKVRALLGQTIIDMKTPDYENAALALKDSENFLAKWADKELIQPILAPHAPNTLTKEQLETVLEISKKHNTRIMMHVEEMTYEMDKFREEYNQTPIEFLEDLGYFEHDFLMAHCILMNENDIHIVKNYPKVKIAHCITANTKSAKGIAPVKLMKENGITVALGTDGPSSGNTLDLFTQMRMTPNFQKVANLSRDIFPAKEIVEMATIEGAKALGLEEKVGTLEVGKQADMALLETQSVNMFPIFNPYSVVVYSARAENVSHTWVNGQLLVADGKLVEQSLEDLRTELYAQMNEFVKEAKRRGEED